MNNALITQFEEMLEGGRLEEAKKTLAALLGKKPTAEEKGEAKALLARLATKLENALSDAYIATLDESIEKLKFLDDKHRELMEKVKLAKARASLAE